MSYQGSVEDPAVDRLALVEPRDEPAGLIGVRLALDDTCGSAGRARGGRGTSRSRRASTPARRLLDERPDATFGIEVDDPVLPRELERTDVAHRDGARDALRPPERDEVAEVESRTGCRRRSRAGRRRRRFGRQRTACRRSRRGGRRWTSCRRRGSSRRARAPSRGTHGALRELVTTCTSSTSVTSARLSTIRSTIGRPPTGSSSFAQVSVSGRRRVA